MKGKLLKKILACTLVASLMVTALGACGDESPVNNEKTETNDNQKETSEEDRFGGEITVAFSSAPENFDPDHASSDWTVTAVTNHVYEGLFEFDNDSNALPQLAESYTLIDDGKTYDIILRKDVKFHDLSEMTAEDVKASLDRWFHVNPAGVGISEYLDEVEIVNDYEIKVKFTQIYAPFINIVASPVSRQKMLVKKKEIIDKFGDDIITEHIGTGPYKFDDIVMGQKVVMSRFDEYSRLGGIASGLTGERKAYIDKVTIEFVPEESVRISGLESGQFDFVDEVSTDRYPELEAYPGVAPTICDHGTMSIVAFNCGKKPFDDVNMRRAIAYAINPQDMALSQVGDEKFWSVEDGSWFKKGNIWYDAKAGEEIYNAKDDEKAKSLIEASSYDGETITILGIKSDVYGSNGALVLQNKLEEIGLNVEVNLVDRSTYFDVIKTTKEWNISLSRWSDMNPDPQVFDPWTGTNGWITNWSGEDAERMDEVFDRMIGEVDYDKRYSIVQEFYDEFWKSVPYFKVFNDKRVYGISDKLKGYANYGQPFFWNCYLED